MWTGDVIVVGGGPAGSTCAAVLARSGLRVLLAARRPSARWQPVEILAPATVQLLRHHRLVDAGEQHGYGVCRGVHGLWNSEPGFLDYTLLACDAGVAVNRSVFDAQLVARAAAAGAHILADATVERILRAPDGGWLASVVRGDQPVGARAAVLIEAVGRAARSIGTGLAEREYFDRLVAMACPIALRPSEYQIMLLEADRQGWWYSTCDGSGDGAAVYLSDADLIPRDARGRARMFRCRFASTRLIGKQLPNLPKTLAIRMMDARTSRRKRLCTTASLAVGDAAYAIDPLSGGGVRRGVETALQAARAVTSFLGANDARALEEYENWANSDFERWLANKNAVYTSADPCLLPHTFWKRRKAPATMSAAHPVATLQ